MSAVDEFYNGVGPDNVGVENPAVDAFEITPSDANELSEVTRAIYAGSSGNIAVVMKSGAEVTFVGVLQGTVLPVRVRKVKSTGTTATNLIGLV